MRERSAAFAQHAEAVRVVDDEPRVELFGQREQPGQGGQVAVHAEHGIGCDQPASGLRRRHPGAERRDVAVRIADELRARQQRAVVEARVVQLVTEDRVAAADERREDREIGEIASRERQRPRTGAGSHERRKLHFQ